MVYTDNIFNEYGKIPTDSNFWNQSIDNFVSSAGFTSGFRKVLGEQVFKANKEIRTPFYSRFAGKPIDAGVGWTERALKDSGVQYWKPKATAEDALGYTDSEGIEKSFTINVQMWKRVSVPSDLASLDDFIARSGIGELNSRIVDTVTRGYQNAMESEIQKKAVSLTKNAMEVDIATDGIVESMGQIMDKATEMMSDDYHYNELTDDENENLITRSDKIFMFINQKYLNAYRNAKANLPSPNELVSNVEIIPMLNDIVKPITSEEFAGGPRSGVSWDTADKPVAIDEPAPIAYLVGDGKIEYRPVRGSYKINEQFNGAGDFTNVHLIARGSIAVRPWENAVRVNLKA